MARTTSTSVALIIEVDTTISLTPFIEIANAMVTKHCVDDDFTAAELELIERWLSAHFYALRDPRATSETAKGVGQTYQHAEEVGIGSTQYGQTAMQLDWSGALSSLNRSILKGLRRSVALDWSGKSLSEQTSSS